MEGTYTPNIGLFIPNGNSRFDLDHFIINWMTIDEEIVKGSRVFVDDIPPLQPYEGMDWWSPSEKQLRKYIEGDFRSLGGGGFLSVYEEVIIYDEPTNMIPIPLTDMTFNIDVDTMFIAEDTKPLHRGVHYTISNNMIIKSDGEWEVGTSLYITMLLLTDITSNPLGMVQHEYTYTALIDGEDAIPITSQYYNPYSDAVIPYYKGNRMVLGKNYSRMSDNTGIYLINWSLKAGESIDFEIRKYTRLEVNGTDGYMINDGTIPIQKLETTLRQNIEKIPLEADLVTSVNINQYVDTNITDDVTETTYKLGIQNGLLYYEEV